MEVRLAGNPQVAQDVQSLFEDLCPLLEVHPLRRVLTPHAVLRIAHAGAKNRSPIRQVVERRPLQREVERVARPGDHAGGPEFHLRRPLRDRGEEIDRLVARLREQAVPDPHGIEPGLLRMLREIQEIRQGVIRGDQRLAVVEIHAELHGTTHALCFPSAARRRLAFRWAPVPEGAFATGRSGSVS